MASPKRRSLKFVDKWKAEEKKDFKEPNLAPAFYFRVEFGAKTGAGGNSSPADTSFLEVSGLNAEMELEPVPEGGENRFTHQLPKGVKFPKLSLKRGIAGLDSPLVKWCRETLEGGFVKPITPMPLTVRLLDRTGGPLRTWSIVNAYPVRWEVEGFNSTKNEIAIEKIELSYNYANRIL